MTLKIVNENKMARAEGDWLRLSGAFTWLTNLVSAREDLTVTIAPGAGWGAAAALLPPAASIEIDGKLWPKKFAVKNAKPRDVSDWKHYPAIMGLFIHEAGGHGDHSRWMDAISDNLGKLSADDQHAFGAAELLEEARCEHRHILDRPQDIIWLQASAATLTLADAMKADLGVRKTCFRSAALLLARADGGSLAECPELDALRALIQAGIGPELLGKLQAVWQQFLDTDDGDANTLMALGKQWYDLTQDDGSAGSGGTLPPALTGALGELAAAAMGVASGESELSDFLAELAEAVARKVGEAKKQAEAHKDAREIFHGEGAGEATGKSALRGWRPPTAAERRLALQTSRDILSAYIREKAVTAITSDRPPGRLNPRAAMQADAQRAMGMYPTAQMFRRKDRRHTPSPPLKVGIVVDTSSSQSGPATASMSGAYSLAAAVRAIPDGEVGVVTFGDQAERVMGPWDAAKGAPKVEATGGTNFLQKTIRSLEGELHLMRPGTARLLVIVTDGDLAGDYFGRDEMLKRYLNAGVRVLWVVTGRVQKYPLSSRVGPNGKSRNTYWMIPEITHPLYRIARPYRNNDKIPETITAEAVRTLKETG